MLCFVLLFVVLCQELSIWAYPTSAGIFEDSIVCCIKENPEPVVFSICCQGVRPELELDRKQLHFEKLLLHRLGSPRAAQPPAKPDLASWASSYFAVSHLTQGLAVCLHFLWSSLGLLRMTAEVITPVALHNTPTSITHCPAMRA